MSALLLYQVAQHSDVGSREALKEAGPTPGGFRCAPDKFSADLLFPELTFGGKVIWLSRDK